MSRNKKFMSILLCFAMIVSLFVGVSPTIVKAGSDGSSGSPVPSNPSGGSGFVTSKIVGFGAKFSLAYRDDVLKLHKPNGDGALYSALYDSSTINACYTIAFDKSGGLIGTGSNDYPIMTMAYLGSTGSVKRLSNFTRMNKDKFNKVFNTDNDDIFEHSPSEAKEKEGEVFGLKNIIVDSLSGGSACSLKNSKFSQWCDKYFSNQSGATPKAKKRLYQQNENNGGYSEDKESNYGRAQFYNDFKDNLDHGEGALTDFMSKKEFVEEGVLVIEPFAVYEDLGKGGANNAVGITYPTACMVKKRNGDMNIHRQFQNLFGQYGSSMDAAGLTPLMSLGNFYNTRGRKGCNYNPAGGNNGSIVHASKCDRYNKSSDHKTTDDWKELITSTSYKDYKFCQGWAVYGIYNETPIEESESESKSGINVSVRYTYAGEGRYDISQAISYGSSYKNENGTATTNCFDNASNLVPSMVDLPTTKMTDFKGRKAVDQDDTYADVLNIDEGTNDWYNGYRTYKYGGGYLSYFPFYEEITTDDKGNTTTKVVGDDTVSSFVKWGGIRDSVEGYLGTLNVSGESKPIGNSHDNIGNYYVGPGNTLESKFGDSTNDMMKYMCDEADEDGESIIKTNDLSAKSASDLYIDSGSVNGSDIGIQSKIAFNIFGFYHNGSSSVGVTCNDDGRLKATKVKGTKDEDENNWNRVGFAAEYLVKSLNVTSRVSYARISYNDDLQVEHTELLNNTDDKHSGANIELTYDITNPSSKFDIKRTNKDYRLYIVAVPNNSDEGFKDTQFDADGKVISASQAGNNSNEYLLKNNANGSKIWDKVFAKARSKVVNKAIGERELLTLEDMTSVIEDYTQRKNVYSKAYRTQTSLGVGCLHDDGYSIYVLEYKIPEEIELTSDLNLQDYQLNYVYPKAMMTSSDGNKTNSDTIKNVVTASNETITYELEETKLCEVAKKKNELNKKAYDEMLKGFKEYMGVENVGNSNSPEVYAKADLNLARYINCSHDDFLKVDGRCNIYNVRWYAEHGNTGTLANESFSTSEYLTFLYACRNWGKPNNLEYIHLGERNNYTISSSNESNTFCTKSMVDYFTNLFMPTYTELKGPRENQVKDDDEFWIYTKYNKSNDSDVKYMHGSTVEKEKTLLTEAESRYSWSYDSNMMYNTGKIFDTLIKIKKTEPSDEVKSTDSTGHSSWGSDFNADLAYNLTRGVVGDKRTLSALSVDDSEAGAGNDKVYMMKNLDTCYGNKPETTTQQDVRNQYIENVGAARNSYTTWTTCSDTIVFKTSWVHGGRQPKEFDFSTAHKETVIADIPSGRDKDWFEDNITYEKLSKNPGNGGWSYPDMVAIEKKITYTSVSKENEDEEDKSYIEYSYTDGGGRTVKATEQPYNYDTRLNNFKNNYKEDMLKKPTVIDGSASSSAYASEYVECSGSTSLRESDSRPLLFNNFAIYGFSNKIKEKIFKYRTTTIACQANTSHNTYVSGKGVMTGGTLDVRVPSNGINRTESSLGTGYAQALVRGYADTSSNGYAKLNYYPEVRMKAYITNGNVLTEGGIHPRTVLTMGEVKRHTMSSAMYFLRVKSTVNDKKNAEGTIYSDTMGTGTNSDVLSKSKGNKPVIYGGSDITLNVNSNFSLNMYGYALDVINYDEDKDGLKYNEAVTVPYRSIIHDTSEDYRDPYTSWGNGEGTEANDSTKKLFSDYKDWVNKVAGSLGVDMTLKVGTGTNAKYFNDFSVSLGKIDTTHSTEDGVYNLYIRRGELDKNSGSYKLMIQQMAIDYGCTYEEAVALFESSGIYQTILESIEDIKDSENNSQIIKDPNNAVRTEDADTHWYDEEVKTLVIRRYATEDIHAKNIIMNDKIDYGLTPDSNAGKNSISNAQQNSYSGYDASWYMTLYMKDNYKDSNKLMYFTEQALFNSSNGRTNSSESYYTGGNVLVDELHVDGADFVVPSATTDDTVR